MEQGYIILPRNFFSADIWQQTRVFSEAEAWIDIIASVRYTHSTCTMMVNGKSVSYTHGEWPASLRFLAKRWQWTVRHVRTFLEKLIACNLVTVRKCGAQNIICVIGYGSTCSGTDSDTDSDTVSDIESGTISDRGTSHEETPFGTPSDTPSGTKKNKDINIFINDNNAHAHESIQLFIKHPSLCIPSVSTKFCGSHPRRPAVGYQSVTASYQKDKEPTWPPSRSFSHLRSMSWLSSHLANGTPHCNTSRNAPFAPQPRSDCSNSFT